MIITPKYRNIRFSVVVSVFNEEPDTDLTRMAERVMEAIIPHPDSRIATSKAGESVTVLVEDWEFGGGQ